MTRWVVQWASGPYGPNGGGNKFFRIDDPSWSSKLDHLTLYYPTKQEAERLRSSLCTNPGKYITVEEVVLPKTVADWIMDLYK